MTKLFVVGFSFVFLFVLGVFGFYAGYTIDGAPMGKMEVEQDAWQEADYGLDVVYSFWDQKARDNAIFGAFAYLWHMITFNIDGVPFWMQGVVLLVVILDLVVVFMLIRGN